VSHFETFDCRKVVVNDLSETFECRKVVADDLSETFDCRKEVAGDLSEAFECRKVVADDLSETFDCRKVVAGDLSEAFECRKVVADDLSEPFDCLKEVAGDLSEAFDHRRGSGQVSGNAARRPRARLDSRGTRRLSIPLMFSLGPVAADDCVSHLELEREPARETRARNQSGLGRAAAPPVAGRVVTVEAGQSSLAGAAVIKEAQHA
jgi:hypothetical protein